MAVLRYRLQVVFVLVISLAAGSCAKQKNLDAKPESVPEPTNRYLVRFSDQWLEPEAIKEQANGKVQAVEHVRENLYVVHFADALTSDEAARNLSSTSTLLSVDAIEPDIVVHAFQPASLPNDPQAASQWQHQAIHTFEAWDVGTGTQDITVAIIDTGTDPSHPDLATRIDPQGYNFVANNTNIVADDAPHFHGTHVSGLIGAIANNGIGGTGVAQHVKIMPLKFLDNRGAGFISNAVRAIDYAVSKHVQIISNSWGGTQGSQELLAAIQRASAAGILFIAAAGNGGNDGVGDNNDQVATYPANYNTPNMISVAATNTQDGLTSFSNFGPTSVHVAAPGENILSTMNGGGMQLMSGTSMATPIVSGLAALIWSQKPSLSASEVKQILLSTVDAVPSLSGKIISGGRINALKAMQAVGGVAPGPSPSPSPTLTPGGGVAKAPLLAGQLELRDQNPYLSVPLTYDVREFSGVASVYVEVTKPNSSFSNPNGNLPDPAHFSFAQSAGTQGQIDFTPYQGLPGWGVYQFRVIPLSQSGQAIGLFSNPATLTLLP